MAATELAALVQAGKASCREMVQAAFPAGADLDPSWLAGWPAAIRSA